MATAEQIKMLIKSHYSEKPGTFDSVAMQIAAYEAKKGRTEYSRELRSIVENAKKQKTTYSLGNADGLIDFSDPKVRRSNLILEDAVGEKINEIIHEFWNQEKLESYGLKNKRKILLAGPPGTGKTMTASALANELGLPLGIIQMDKMMTKYMGETNIKLRQIFESIDTFSAVYLFDEFDAIGSDRNSDNDIGEIRRILNTFLQLIEQNESNSLIIAATNSIHSLDTALFRRFDEVIYYEMLNSSKIEKLIEVSFNEFKLNKGTLKKAAQVATGLSQSEIVKAVSNTLKNTILYNKGIISEEYLFNSFLDLKKNYKEN